MDRLPKVLKYIISVLWKNISFSTDIDDCAGVTCNNGRCIDLVAGFSCQCTVGYGGQSCQTGLCGTMSYLYNSKSTIFRKVFN